MMRWIGTAAATVLIVAVSVAAAQGPPTGPMPGQGGSPPAPGMPHGMMGGGSGGMMSGMMCPMMMSGGGMMGGGGMGMMGPGMLGGPAQDPTMLGRMLQLRADMMRAMADVLARHGKALEDGK